MTNKWPTVAFRQTRRPIRCPVIEQRAPDRLFARSNRFCCSRLLDHLYENCPGVFGISHFPHESHAPAMDSISRLPNAGPTYAYSFDSMSRPIGLTDQNNYAAVSGVQYGGSCALANQLSSMSYFGVTESRCYNTQMQLTNVTVGGQLNITYNYPTGTNNGKISSQTDAISGETVTYAYDSLNRMLSASGSGWTDTYAYDGFGNLTTKTPTGGAPQLSVGVNPANNRIRTANPG